jgi:hypothetical protein
VGNWACLDEGGMYARVSEWIDGVAPTTSADTSLAGWLGRTVAVIEHLALPGDHRAEAAYPVQSVADWRLWLDEARAAGMLDVRQARGLSAAVTDATALMQAALAADHVFQLAHRDVNRRNMLMTDRGPLLLDFDYAGPEVPWWEFVHHAFDLASPRLGDYPPRPEQVDAALTAYQETGASAGTAEPEAFAGLLRATLGAAAYDPWLALGHRPADADRRSTAAWVVRDLAGQLPAIVKSIDRWTRLIR